MHVPKVPDWLYVLAVCALACALRIHHLDAPIADNLQAKQTYSSNKARNIARVPFDPMRLSLDLLDDAGQPMQLAEEVPVYIGVLAAGFVALGESEVWGRLLSIAGSVFAIVAFFLLARREHGDRLARTAALLFACMPLFIFYGRAIMPDSWMLGMMLATALAYRRYLDDRRVRWLAIAALCGALTVLLKYWGLMILLVIADMHRANRGWRAWFQPDFAAFSAILVLPTALWMLLVFAPAPNPVQNGWVAGQPASPYLVFQQPGALANRGFYAAFFSRFLVRDCGFVTAALIAVGAFAVLRRKAPTELDRPSLARWTAMGLVFFVLLAPKMIDHDYYELMMLPAAAIWASAGLWAIADRLNGATARARGFVVRATLLSAAVIIQSPWISGGMFHLESGKIALGRSLARATKPGDRVVALGPAIALIVPVHYSERLGWAVRAETLPDHWERQLRDWRRQGAKAIGLYFNGKTKPDERRSYQPLIDALPIVEHQSASLGSREADYEYLVLKMDDDRLAALGEHDRARR